MSCKGFLIMNAGQRSQFNTCKCQWFSHFEWICIVAFAVKVRCTLCQKGGSLSFTLKTHLNCSILCRIVTQILTQEHHGDVYLIYILEHLFIYNISLKHFQKDERFVDNRYFTDKVLTMQIGDACICLLGV